MDTEWSWFGSSLTFSFLDSPRSFSAFIPVVTSFDFQIWIYGRDIWVISIISCSLISRLVRLVTVVDRIEWYAVLLHFTFIPIFLAAVDVHLEIIFLQMFPR